MIRKRQNKRGKGRERVETGDSKSRQVSIASGETLVLRGPLITPDRIVVKLKYLDEVYQRNNATAANGSFRFRSNSVFDPDPALGSGGITGFNEWAALYGNYRVLAYAVDWNVVNLESFPVLVGMFPTNTDIGGNAASIAQYTEGPYAKKAILSPTGGMDRAHLRWQSSIKKIVGTDEALFDDNYQALVSTNPANLVFHNFAMIPGKSLALVNGISSNLTIEYLVEFFERKPITS